MKDLGRNLIKAVLIFFAFLIFLIPYPGYSNKLKSALKQLNKGQFEKTKQILDKSLAKEIFNPGAKYIYSLFYTRIDNEAYNLDSGYHYILASIIEFDSLDEKNKKKLNKLFINDSTLALQKFKIEELAFDGYSSRNTEEGYTEFIKKFPTAPQVPEAIKRRDDIALKEALEQNTSKSYQAFLLKYPESPLADQARENYELKLFQEATGTGTLEGYINFLAKNPESPYRARAEEKVFKISTILNEPDSFESFLKKFPENKNSRTAYTYLLYHYFEENKLEEFNKKFPKNPYFQRASKLLNRKDSVYFVFYDNNQFGFVNELGGQLSKARFDGVMEEYLCEGVEDEFILFTQDGKFGAIDKTGIPILPAEFKEIEKIGTGTLRVIEDSTYALHLMDGSKLIKEEFEEIEALNNSFIKVKSKKLWGIRGMNGFEILAPAYDEIFFIENNFFILKQNEKYAVLRSNELIEFAETGKVNLDFKYDGIEEVDDKFLEVKINDNKGIIDSTLNNLLPINYSSIQLTDKTWLAKRNEGIEMFNLKGSPVSGGTFSNVVRGKETFAVKRNNKWGIINRSGLMILPVEKDSVILIGDKIALIFAGDGVSGFFNLQKEIPLPEYENFEVQTSALNPIDSTRSQYLLLEGKDGKISIFNHRGKLLFKPLYDKITVATDNLFIVEQKGKTGIVDSTGKVQLPLKYDGIGNYKEGYVSILKSSKFGIFNPSNKVLIQPKFDALIKVFDAEGKVFLALDNGGYAFIDQKGKLLSDHKFKEAGKWKSDTVLVKEGNVYYLYSIENKEKVSDDFQSIKFIQNTDSTKVGLIYADGKYGVLSNTRDFVVPLKYNDITNLGSGERPFYMAEHQVEEADLYVVLYINSSGQIVMSQAYKSGEYERLLCED